MPPRRRAARARYPAEPVPEPAPGVDLAEASLVAGLSQLHIHVHLNSAASAADSASRAPRSGPLEDPFIQPIQPRCEEADIRFYVVWHLPGHPGIHGVFVGPHPLAWRSIASFLPGGRLAGSGAALTRQPTEAEAILVYRHERAQYPRLPREPNIHRVQ
jgi:hypothetical protein